MVDLYGTFTFLVQAHMWNIHLHHIQIKNISNILMSNAKKIICWKIATLIYWNPIKL
jgi:hypothetical protein